MADQTSTSTIDQAVDDVVRDVERAQAALGYRDACVSRMASLIRLGAIAAYNRGLGVIGAEALDMVMQTPAAAEPMTAAVLAAGAEGQRLLAAIGVDLPAVALPTPDGAL